MITHDFSGDLRDFCKLIRFNKKGGLGTVNLGRNPVLFFSFVGNGKQTTIFFTKRKRFFGSEFTRMLETDKSM